MAACEIFRFYKLIPTKSLIEPVSMIVPRRVSQPQVMFISKYQWKNEGTASSV